MRMPAVHLRSSLRGASYALLAAALCGLNGSASKVVIAADLNPSQVTLMRVLATAALSGAWLAIAGRRHFAVTRRELGALALLFEYTAVILVALAAWLVFGERIGARLRWAIGAVLVGLAVAFWASTFASAFWVIFSGWWNIDPGLFTYQVSLTGALESMVVPLWVPLVFILTLGSFVPFDLLFMALRHTSATAVGNAASSEVLFAFAVAWVWLGENLSMLQVAGSVVVFAGIVVAQTARKSSTARLEPPVVGEFTPSRT
jgi:drug/metabolite transporter (DMT)-like permease